MQLSRRQVNNNFVINKCFPLFYFNSKTVFGAEITYPAPEGASNGLLLLMGQISGIIFIIGMDSFKSPATGSMTLPLVVLTGLMILSLLLCTRIKESTLVKENPGS